MQKGRNQRAFERSLRASRSKQPIPIGDGLIGLAERLCNDHLMKEEAPRLVVINEFGNECPPGLPLLLICPLWQCPAISAAIYYPAASRARAGGGGNQRS